MKALTVQPPWSVAIRQGVKLTENRSWGTSYRGPLLIVSGARWSRRGARDVRIIGWWRHALDVEQLDATDFGYAFRKALCVAELADCHPDVGCCRPWGESRYTDDDGKTRTALWHWALEDVRPLAPPLPAKGRLGLWTPGPDLADAVAAALDATAVWLAAMAGHVNAYSGRSTVGADGPLLHASPNPPVPYSRTGATYRAACGAQVRNVTRVGWDPAGVGRRCQECVRAVPR